MNFYHFVRLKLRSQFTFLAVVGLIVALFLGSAPQLGWAAPDQNPRLQTVPPRPDEPEPEPDPGGEPNENDGNNNGNEEGVDNGQDEPSSNRPSNDDNDDEEEEERNNSGSPTQNPNKVDGQTETESIGASEPENNDENSPVEAPQVESEAPAQSNPSTQAASAQEETDEAVPVMPQQADLSLIQEVNNPTPSVGETITFTTTINNNGPSRAINVIIKNQLPLGLALSSTFADRGDYDAVKGFWTIGTIAQGEQVTLNLVARVNQALPAAMIAEVIAVDQADPDSIPNNYHENEDDQASVSITPLEEISLENSDEVTSLAPASPQGEAAPAIEVAALPYNSDWIYWLGAVIAGIVFIFIGVQLVHRS